MHRQIGHVRLVLDAQVEPAQRRAVRRRRQIDRSLWSLVQVQLQRTQWTGRSHRAGVRTEAERGAARRNQQRRQTAAGQLRRNAIVAGAASAAAAAAGQAHAGQRVERALRRAGRAQVM